LILRRLIDTLRAAPRYMAAALSMPPRRHAAVSLLLMMRYDARCFDTITLMLIC